MHAWIDLAELVSTKNLKGGLVARSASGLPLLLSEGMELALVPPVLDAPRDVVVESLQFRSDDEAVVYFAEVTDADTAKILVGCHCLAWREDVEEELESLAEGEDALPDWDGWTVFDTDAGYVGVISHVEERPLQPLLVVVGEEGADVLIPLVDEFVLNVDEEERRLDLQCPAGLLDL